MVLRSLIREMIYSGEVLHLVNESLQDIDTVSGVQLNLFGTPDAKLNLFGVPDENLAIVGGRPRAYILGDSHAAGPFGVSLERELLTRGFDVVRAAKGATAARTWLQGDTATIQIPSGESRDIPAGKISRHYQLKDLQVSSSAKKYGLDNTPTSAAAEALTGLAQNILDPLKDRVPDLRISSGYRSPAVNSKVGGVSNSQHMTGEAADVSSSSMSALELAQLIVNMGLPFDQVIWYAPSRGGHVHVSYSTRRTPRKKTMHAPSKGGYSSWNPSSSGMHLQENFPIAQGQGTATIITDVISPSTLARDHGPFDLGIIVLGTNDGANSNVVAKSDPVKLNDLVADEALKIKRIAELMGAKTTVWVGPPGLTGKALWYTIESANAVYDQVGPLFPGTTYDSRHIRPDDGVHAYGSNAANWAADVADFAASLAGV